MCPDVKRLIGQLEQAQDAVSGWAAGVSVPGDDAVLMENLKKGNTSVSLELVWSLLETWSCVFKYNSWNEAFTLLCFFKKCLNTE